MAICVIPILTVIIVVKRLKNIAFYMTKTLMLKVVISSIWYTQNITFNLTYWRQMPQDMKILELLIYSVESFEQYLSFFASKLVSMY